MRFRLIGSHIYHASATSAPGNRAQPDEAVLSGTGMTVKSGLHLHALSEIEGISLLGAKVGTLIDSDDAWKFGEGRNRFDGFVYDRIADEARGVCRKTWLLGQRKRDLGQSLDAENIDERGFRRQPWQQAAQALDNSGEFAAARRLRIAMWWHGLIARGWSLSALPFRVLMFIYHGLAGSGYGYGRLATITTGLWILGIILVNCMAASQQFYPSSLSAQPNFRCGSTWEIPLAGGRVASCEVLPKPPDPAKLGDTPSPVLYPVLNPLLYSLDNIVPLVDFNQRKQWLAKPGTWGYWLLLLQYIYGYVAASALVGLVGSYVVRKPL
jgi:hypothetical protein